MQIEWWHWAVAGIGLILAELAVPSFVLVWFGLGALLVAGLLFLLPQLPLTLQLALWLMDSLVLVALWFKVFKKSHHRTRIGMSDANVIGEIGLLTRSVAPFEKGEVRFQKPLMGAETWACIADSPVPAGARVKVIGIEGSLLKVGPT